jgi:hypothetical protein
MILVLARTLCEHVRYEPKGLHEFTVESREPGTRAWRLMINF